MVNLALERPTDEMWGHFERFMVVAERDSPAYVPVARAQRMVVAIRSGREDEAFRDLMWFRRIGFASIQRTMMWPVAIVRLATATAHLRAIDESASLYDALLPFAAGNAQNSGAVTYEGSYSHHLGVLAAALGRWDAGDRHFADAAAMHERMGARAWLARTRLEWAIMLDARHRPEDAERTCTYVADALDAARRLHLPVLERRALALRSCDATSG
jgi:hypothetical protein